MTQIFAPLSVEDSLLVLIDMQERLVPAMDRSAAAVARQALALDGARELGLRVLATEQYPQGLGATLPELAARFPANTRVVAKTSFSCFGEERFRDAVRASGATTLLLAGCEAHVCVQQTLLDARAAGLKVVLLADAVTSRHPENVALALALARDAGAMVTGVESALFALLGDAKNPAFKAVSRLVR